MVSFHRDHSILDKVDRPHDPVSQLSPAWEDKLVRRGHLDKREAMQRKVSVHAAQGLLAQLEALEGPDFPGDGIRMFRDLVPTRSARS